MLDDVSQLPHKIQEHIIETTSRELTHRNEQVHVTELLYCLRKAYLRRTLPEISRDIEQRWYTYRGIVFDQLWTGLFDRNQVRVTHRIPDGPTIVGVIDFIAYENDEPVIYELKTIANRYAIKNGPKDDHIKQVKFYAYCENVLRAKLVYVSFEGVKIFDIHATDAPVTVYWLEDRARQLYEALKKKIPPAKTDREWECRYCEVADHCAAIEGVGEGVA